MRRPLRRVALAATIVAATLSATAGTASADPALTGEAGAFAATLSIGGSEVIPPTPEVSSTLPPGGDAEDTTIPIDADPVAVNGTLVAKASTHVAGDLDSELAVVDQMVDGPYNARAVGMVEGLDVLFSEPEVSLLTAEVLRAEAVAVCSGTTATYTANSEIVNLEVQENPIPLNDGLTQLIDAITDALGQSGLDALVSVERNVVTELEAPAGVAVDALVVTVLPVGGDVISITLGHAEVRDVSCGAAPPPPECSDGVNNDDDPWIDFPDDPGCDSADDPTEDPNPECSDGVDNDGDGLIDFDGGGQTEVDPGCDDKHEDDETNEAAREPELPFTDLPRTGGPESGLVAGLALTGLAGLGLALRRRVSLT